jgi:excisionase family DNA binding protein
MTAAEVEPLAYSPADAARAIGTSRAYVYRLIAEGRLAARKLPTIGSATTTSRTVIEAAELRRFIEAQPHAPTDAERAGESA